MTRPLSVARLLTNHAALGETVIARSEEPAGLADGEVLLKIDRIALTTNNITYAAFGDAMQYWGFLPAGRPRFGHMPVWGFGDVVASGVAGIAAGERFYGYYPIASHIRMQHEWMPTIRFFCG